MKKVHNWLSTALVLSLLLGLLSTSAWATSVDIVIPVGETFETVGEFSYKDIALVKDSTGYYYVTVENGKLVPAEGTASTASVNLYAAQDATTGKWGYNDQEDGSGTMIIAAVYDQLPCTRLRDWFDVFVAQKDGTWGVFDREGADQGIAGITNASYDQDILYDSVMVQNAAGLWGVVNMQFDWDPLTLEMAYDEILGEDWIDEIDANGPLYWVTSGDKACVVGEVWSEDDFAESVVFSMNASYYQGMYDDEGYYQSQTHFYGDSYLVISNGDKYGIIGLDGNMMVDFIYDQLDSVGSGYFSAVQYDNGGNAALLKFDGTLITGFDYGYFQQFNGLGRIAVASADTYQLGLMNEQGQMVTDGFPYSSLRDVNEGMWAARNDGGLYAILSNDGQLLSDFLYSDTSWYTDGLMAVATTTDDTKTYGLVDTRGDEILPCIYDLLGEYDGSSPSVYDMGYYDYSWIGQANGSGGYTYGVIQKNYDVSMVPQSTNLIINGVATTVNAYATIDSNGGATNYYKIRDIASLLDGTSAQFSVNWYGQVYLTSGEAYSPDGSELTTPFSGNRVGNDDNTDTIVNGEWSSLDTITLTDDNGGGYTYYKLRDLGAVLGFQVGWDSATSSIVITTN